MEPDQVQPRPLALQAGKFDGDFYKLIAWSQAEKRRSAAAAR